MKKLFDMSILSAKKIKILFIVNSRLIDGKLCYILGNAENKWPPTILCSRTNYKAPAAQVAKERALPSLLSFGSSVSDSEKLMGWIIKQLTKFLKRVFKTSFDPLAIPNVDTVQIPYIGFNLGTYLSKGSTRGLSNFKMHKPCLKEDKKNPHTRVFVAVLEFEPLDIQYKVGYSLHLCTLG